MSNQPTYTSPNGTVYIAGGKDANCTLSVCPVEYSVYGYRPSIEASTILIGLFSLCMVVQVYLGRRYHAWGYTSAICLGCVDEILGYVGRILLYQNPWNNAGFIMQIVLITIGPVFFSGAIYFLLHQIVVYISIESSRFKPVWFYYIFIPSDIVSLILQAAGGALSSTSNGGSDVGVNIALAGLGFQVFTLAVFTGLAVDYAFRSKCVWGRVRLPRLFLVFIASTALATILIFARCCYRLYELNGGYSRDSKALRDEDLFIALESAVVIVAALLLILAHPGPVFSGSAEKLTTYEKVDPSATESTALHSLIPRSSMEQRAYRADGSQPYDHTV